MHSSIKHIAIADDDSDNIEMLSEAVKKYCPDIKFTYADDGHMLLEKLNNPPLPDFIILDINMPRLDGRDCLKAIKSNSRLKEIPVMMYSTSSLHNDINEALSNGANYYVSKPNGINEVNKIAKAICDGTIVSSFD